MMNLKRDFILSGKMINILITLLVGLVLAEIQEYTCDIDVNEKICIEESGLEITKPWSDPDSYGMWSFDFEKYIDQSTLRHITNVENVERTFSVNGFGSAALFTRSSIFESYLVPPWTITDSTLSFLLYFDDLIRSGTSNKTTSNICGIIHLYEH
jgi:hypothetical protein